MTPKMIVMTRGITDTIAKSIFWVLNAYDVQIAENMMTMRR